MDFQLRQIAGNKPAGQYFIVSDLSNATEIMPNRNVRVVFLNEKQGVVNTAVYFERGAVGAFENMFGKRNRRSEKLGNFGIKDALTMLGTAPIIAINLRAFDSELDKTQLVNMGANKIWSVEREVPYSGLFNKTGFWMPKPKNILKPFGTDENLLNFANVGEGDVSIMVTMSTPTEVSNLTQEYNKSIADSDLEIQEFPALIEDANKLVSDTFVNVYIFKNNFADKLDNVTYRHLFNEAGLISQSNIEALTGIKTSGFYRKFTGSLIPYLKGGTNDLSIDTILNQYYQETGVYCTINSEVLEQESYGGYPVLNTLGFGYHKADGNLVDDGNLLSYRYQNNPENIAKVELGVDDNGNDYRQKEILIYSGEIFPKNAETSVVEKYGDKVFAILENGIRVGNILTFEDRVTGDLVSTTVTSLMLNEEVNKELPKVDIAGISYELTIENGKPKIVITNALNNVTYNVMRKRLGEDNFVAIRTNSDKTFIDTGATDSQTYIYSIVVKNAEFSDNALASKQIKVLADEVATPSTELPTLTVKKISFKKVLLTTDKNINADSYMRVLKNYANDKLKVEMSTLSGYSQRPEQFVNGTASRQNQILDVMNTPSIVGGITKLGNVGYLIDTFKSYIEAGYKRQFGNLIGQLDECNRFVTAILNEVFVEDLEDSTNPLFKDTPNGDLDLSQYLAQGGNPNFSTQFLSKFTYNASNCAFYGAEEVEPNIYPNAGMTSNLYVTKSVPWAIVANSRGVLPIAGVEIDAQTDVRKAMEMFGWNPIIKVGNQFRIYGNRSGQIGNSALRDFNNAELLKYIKTELVNMSINDAFTTGTYDELLAFETRVKEFMDSLSLQNAIKPNPTVKVLAVNNEETEEAGIKLCEIEYYNFRTLDKVVFSLKLK